MVNFKNAVSLYARYTIVSTLMYNLLYVLATFPCSTFSSIEQTHYVSEMFIWWHWTTEKLICVL